MTLKLYDEDHYLREFDAKVVSIVDGLVELDKTAFFPESGGQTGDSGILNGEKVVYTKYLDDEKVVHVMKGQPGFMVGDAVHGVFDWDRRYRIMKLHSASHIMEYFLWGHFGFMKRIGSSVDDRKDRADYQHDGRLDRDKLKQVEDDTNDFLEEGHPINITVDSEGIRTWRCGPVEMQCGGTHVRNTSEIGEIRLKRKNPGRGKERVETSLKE
jgi:Ser-tRNA(Ala) deacylase AlaX